MYKYRGRLVRAHLKMLLRTTMWYRTISKKATYEIADIILVNLMLAVIAKNTLLVKIEEKFQRRNRKQVVRTMK